MTKIPLYILVNFYQNMNGEKNEKENLTLAELSYLQMLAQDLLEYTDSDLDTTIIEGKIQEVHHA